MCIHCSGDPRWVCECGAHPFATDDRCPRCNRPAPRRMLPKVQDRGVVHEVIYHRLPKT